MRFNDLLRTVLASNGDGAHAIVTRWRQCIDLLAQYDISGGRGASALSAEDRDRVLGIIGEIRSSLTLDQRVTAIVELGGRLRSPGLVRLLAGDHPTLVCATMAGARLSDTDWAAIIPELGPLARSVLRRRTALGPLARQALERFGPIDLALPAAIVAHDAAPRASASVSPIRPEPESPANAGATAPAAQAAQDEPSQIGRIVAQIERFTGARGQRHPVSAVPGPSLVEPEPTPEPEPESVIERFTFEADVTGVIQHASGAPRLSVVGLSIGTAGIDSRLGADGTALGAFRRRAAFAEARFSIGEGRLRGEWRISGEPRFDSASGRFIGYVGSARREQAHEGLVRSGSPVGWHGLSAQNTRQLIHELRTPLNAIQGFAEMIETQMLGPVASDYRAMARSILSDAGMLIATFDDLDLAGRLERGDAGAGREALDLIMIVRHVLRPFAEEAGEHILLDAAASLPPVAGDSAQIERMLSHLLRAGCAALDEGEQLHLRLSADPGAPFVRLAMQRPRALNGLAEPQLLDHGTSFDQRLGAVPPLGLAFTLRLVRGIATHLGGRFDIAADLFTIALPVRQVADTGQESLR